MGIRGLHTFATNVVRDGWKPVNMKEEIKDYQGLKGRKPILVIDILSFMYVVYHGEPEKLVGGIFPKFNERLHNILSTLSSLGFEMVFYADGATQDRKMDTCLQRRNDEYSRGVHILHAIDRGLDFSHTDFRKEAPQLSAFNENMIQISREHGELFISGENECDQEMVRLANERDAFAIVTNDTDFFIFDGSWRFWRDLNIKRGTANQYNKAALRQHLKLSPLEMKFLASLAGNDFLSYDELLKPFHKSVFRYPAEKFDKIAAYIKRNLRGPNALHKDGILYLSQRIFKRENFYQGMEALQHSIKFYSLTDMQDESDEFLRRVSQECSRFIYSLLKKDIVIVPFGFCDLSKPIFPPYYEFFKPLLSRLMGVLFSHQDNRNFRKTFKFKLDHYQPFTSVDISASFPPSEVPPLQHLLLTPYGENENLDNTRWDMLCFMISPKLKSDQLRSIPGFSLATYVTLFYLVVENLIQIDEADCILFSCQENNNKFNIEKVKTINGRDARMAFLFLRMMYHVSACFSAAGLQKYCGLDHIRRLMLPQLAESVESIGQ